MQRPAADFDITLDVVRAVIEEQHPDLGALELREFDEGWDNVLYRLGPDLVVRLPRREVSVELLLNEQRWLAELAPLLPLPIPAPLRLGRPSAHWNHPWSIVPWIEGTVAEVCADLDEASCASSLGRFLRALHHEAPGDAPRNPFRGGALQGRLDAFTQRCKMIEHLVDLRPAQRAFDQALSAPAFEGPPRWLHGDLHPGNVVVARGTLVGVVDFGDLCAGDPATDLAGGWMLFGPTHLEAYFDAYGAVGEPLRHRALGWAAMFGVFFVSIGITGRDSYERIGRHTLERVAQCVEQ